MKLKLVTMMIAMVAFSAIKVKAQVPDESRIKILKTEKPGVLKLVHALQIEDGVTVNFITDEGIISTDEIKGSYPKGMAKRYDVRRIDKDFWMEVSTPRLSVTYHIIPSSDGKTFTSNLEKAVHKYDVIVASRE
jgi:hypothetical protein